MAPVSAGDGASVRAEVGGSVSIGVTVGIGVMEEAGEDDDIAVGCGVIVG